jgi:hypothetical protein
MANTNQNNKNKTGPVLGAGEDDNFDLSSFSDEYMASVQEQMKKFTENPEMLQKALGPFMKMQREYMENPDKLSQLAEGAKSEADEMLDLIKRIRSRLVRLEKRLEESGVLKPRQE